MRWRTGLLAAALGYALAIADPAVAAGPKARAKSAQASKSKSARGKQASTTKSKAGTGKQSAGSSSGEPAAGGANVTPVGKAQTYTFDAQEVEGRLRSPQILYFLRRVRAQFEPQPLGHRSFLLELRDTQRHRVLR